MDTVRPVTRYLTHRCVGIMVMSLAACGTDEVESVTMLEPSPPAASSVDCAVTPLSGFTHPNTGCDPISIRPAVADAELAGAIGNAAEAWNRATPTRVPRLNPVANTATSATFTVVKNGGGPWCGSVAHNTGTITLETKSTDKCLTNSTANLTALLKHEFGHVLGFSSGGTHSSGVPGVSTHCLMELVAHEPDIPDRDGPCQHEVERLLYAYGGGNLALVSLSDFWNRHIITGAAVSPTGLVLEVGESGTMRVTSLQTARGFFEQIMPPSYPAWDWSKTSPDIEMTRISNNEVRITGIAPVVAANVTLRPTGSAIPSGFALGSAFRQSTKTMTVTVTAPPQDPFRVSDISGVTPPITREGRYWLTAHVENPPAGTTTLEVRWLRDNNTYDSIPAAEVQGWRVASSSNYQMFVDEGSYTIRVIAEARAIAGGTVLSTTYRAEDITVCAGVLGGASTKNGGATPQAVGGCAGGGGGGDGDL